MNACEFCFHLSDENTDRPTNPPSCLRFEHADPSSHELPVLLATPRFLHTEPSVHGPMSLVGMHTCRRSGVLPLLVARYPAGHVQLYVPSAFSPQSGTLPPANEAGKLPSDPPPTSMCEP